MGTTSVVRAIQFLTAGHLIKTLKVSETFRVFHVLLTAELQPFGYAEITLVVAGAQVREQSAALTDHLEQTAAAGLILLVASQMLGELGNAIGQDGDLHFRRTGILVVAMKTFDRLGLDFFCKRHDVCFLSL